MKLDDLAVAAGREVGDIADGAHRPGLPAVVTWRRRRVGIATGLVVGAVTIAAVIASAMPPPAQKPAFTSPADPPSSTTAAPTTTPVAITVEQVPLQATGPAFGGETGVVLLFDDGIDGVLAVDLDNRVGSRRVVEGQRAGDQPHRLRRIGDHLAVGWGEIHAVHIPTGESTLLGDATIYVPAAEPGRAWLVDWQGRAVGSGEAVAWQVDMEGDRVTEPAVLPADVIPEMGIPGGGLALRSVFGSGYGVHLEPWYPESAMADVVEVVPARGSALDVSGDLLAYCPHADCDEVHVRDFDRKATIAGTPSGENWSSARFSPDGERIAAVSDESLAVVGTRTGDLLRVTLGRLARQGSASVTWSSDGTQVFAVRSSYGQAEMTIVHYDLTTGSARSVSLPFAGGSSFVALAVAEAGAFLRDQDQAPQACPAPMVYPTGRTGICGFRF